MVTATELERLSRMHVAKRAVYDADSDQCLELKTPICASCLEIWGEFGCSTVRLIDLHRADAELNVTLTDALAELASKTEWKRTEFDLTASVSVQRVALMRGGKRIIDAMLKDLYEVFIREQAKLLG